MFDPITITLTDGPKDGEIVVESRDRIKGEDLFYIVRNGDDRPIRLAYRPEGRISESAMTAWFVGQHFLDSEG